jgi:hypothetical protein
MSTKREKAIHQYKAWESIIFSEPTDIKWQLNNVYAKQNRQNSNIPWQKQTLEITKKKKFNLNNPIRI